MADEGPPSTLVQFQGLRLLDTEAGCGRVGVPTAGSTLKYFIYTPEILAQLSFTCSLSFFFSIALCDA